MEQRNYVYFLKLYKQYINPIADTIAWCLLKNHFHILIYIKRENEINPSELVYSTVDKPKVIDASRQFSHFFNAYTQAINKRYRRTGSLFEKSFERKLVNSDIYLKNLIYYIHKNPVYHRFASKLTEYRWSSYNEILDKRRTLQRQKMFDLFGNLEIFLYYHDEEQDLSEIETFKID
jgi:REP element-mobilizing transposase RayT